MRRFKAAGVITSSFALLATCISSYRHGWWPSLLDWVVLTIPALVGGIAWVLPVKQSTQFHRIWLLIGGIAMSGLIYLQQWETRVMHAKEIAQLATKDDIAKLPTATDIVLEIRKQRAIEIRTVPADAPATDLLPKNARGKTTSSSPAQQPDPEPVDGIAKDLREIKNMIVGQRWGLSADQLVSLARRMAPFAPTFNSWNSHGDLVTSILGNQDSTRFAGSLVAALRSAGFNLPSAGYAQAIFSGIPEGIIVTLHSREDADTAALNQFVAAIKDAGIEIHGEIQDQVPTGQFRIIIGAKPGG
jgi:hypothetical protein